MPSDFFSPMTQGDARAQRARLFIDALIVLQGFSALYFLSDFVADLISAGDSTVHNFAEGLAVVGLITGIYLSIRERRRLVSRNRHIEAQLQIASGAFQDLLASSFDRWKLTPSEREIALLTIKGFSNAEIADLRKTSEGTVKAQSNAVFRKAEVSGRTQLLSHFIDELVGDPIVKPQQGADVARIETPSSSRQGRISGAAAQSH